MPVRSKRSTPELYLLAHNIRSMWNVGSFFRTADACGVSHVYLTGYTACPPRKEVTKTAIGADEFVDWSYHKDPITIIKTLKKKNVEIVALEQSSKCIDLAKYRSSEKSVCLIVGHEISGVPKDILELCDTIVEIPMLGKKQSLNVSVAAGIALYVIGNALRS